MNDAGTVGGVTPANRLGGETSPYLRQHVDNPVHWFAWGEAAFAEARERDVPVLLSVGYSACHWCHVMAHECFEDHEVAAVMNEHFVNVKVDREERPDVDALYMDAVQAMTGRGGWPMTAFLTPEGSPFYGGTYFPKAQFLQLMHAIHDVWHNRRADVEQNVTALHEALDRTARIEPSRDLPGLDHLNQALGQLASAFDPEGGGFGRAPKFPSTMHLDLVLRAYLSNASEPARAIVETTLDAMASGGMYDHLGGGFARYSTDDRWLVPHFEKMLYDQALLVRGYLHGWQVLGHDRWLQVIDETIGYVLRDLRQPSGGFASAEDADSPGDDGHHHEGLFHTWTPAEVRAALPDDLAEVALDWYGITEAGNVEGRSIPHRLDHRGLLVRPEPVERARQLLLATRDGRPRPGLDDKVLTEWNALMIAALAEAAAATGRADWQAAAVAAGDFLCAELRTPDGRWHRSWQAEGSPRARHHALAADHAALVDAFVRLAELTGRARWLDEARATADVLLDHFWDPVHGGVFTTADDAEALVVRQKDLTDDATPSANAMAAWALQRLAALTAEARYQEHADQILRLLAPVIASTPTACSHALAASELRRTGTVEVVITGERPDLVAAVQRLWMPPVVVAWGEPTGGPLWEGRPEGFAYVCRQYACEAPASTVDELHAALRRALA